MRTATRSALSTPSSPINAALTSAANAPIPGESYTILVPKTDADGNSISGIRTPDVQVPIATYTGWDGSSDTGEALSTWRKAASAANLKDRKHIVDDDRIEVALDASGAKVLQPAAHGGFDNDIDVITRTLERIAGGKLAVGIDDLRGY